MDREELKSLVAKLLEEMDAGTPAPKAEAETPCLPDLAETDLRRQYLVEQPLHGEKFLELKQRTPARIGIGRAGARYRTETYLRFRADHAAAQDSVFSHVYEEFYKSNGYPFVQTLCREGLGVLTESRIALTAEGFLVSDYIMSELMPER